MLFRFVSKLRFLWYSTNQHGVHSPFVFKYLTQCLHKNPEIKGKKSSRVLLKSIPYFKVKSIYIDAIHPLRALIMEKQPDVRFNSPPYDLVFIDIAEWSVLRKEDKDLMYNTSILMFYGITTRQGAKLWEELVLMPQFNVSIDMYYCGVLFTRKEQEKEHFKVRI